MTTILDCPDGTRGEWRFRFFGIPVRVHPWFWLTTLFMGAMQQDTGAALIWVAVCFVSILLHEIGHVVAFHAFGERAEVILYSWGGLAVPALGRRLGTFGQTVVSLAGPAAGFCLAGVVAGVAMFAGAQFQLVFHTLVIPSLTAWFPFADYPDASMSSYYWNVLLNDLLFVNIYWGLVNLLPVYPLDGGQAARALFVRRDPTRGRRRAIKVSAIVAVIVAVLGLITRSMYLVIMFGILAAGSAQMLEAEPAIFRPTQDRRR